MIRNAIITALGAVLALSVGAASAYFTTQLQVPDSIIRAGTIAISTEPTSAPLSLDSLGPGITTTRTMNVVNDGSLPVDVTVTASKKAGITEFYEALNVKVMSGETELYAGPLSQMRTRPLRFAPGSRTELRFEVSLPSTAGNNLIGDYVKVSLYLDGEQAH